MATAAIPAIDKRSGLLRAVFLGGIVAGVLDLLAAITNTRLQIGYGPSMVLKAIASGLLGTHALFRGAGTAFLGLVLHFFVAIYGGVIYVVMNWVVLPFSAFPRALWQRDISFRHIAIALGCHVLLIGIPIALSARWCLTRATGV